MYRTLWPLPGGTGRYFATLLEMLQWVKSQRQAPTSAFHDWMRTRYGLGTDSRTPVSYMQLLARMEAVTIDHGIVQLAQLGAEIVETQDSDLVLNHLLVNCIGTHDVLAAVKRLGVASAKSLLAALRSRYPYWQSPAQYAWRLEWLYSLGCLEKASGGFLITQVGEQSLQAHTIEIDPFTQIDGLLQVAAPAAGTVRPEPDATRQDLGPPAEEETVPVLVLHDEAERLAREVKAAAAESEDAIHFERVLVEVFRFLGFEAEHRGGSGDTDVLITAPLGQESYRAVVDGKSSRHGKVGKQQVDWLALTRHKAQHAADYILVVAPGFSSGDLLDNATKTDAGLLSAEDLAAVVRLHARTPLSLTDLRELFRYAGHPELPLQRVQEKAAEVARLQRLLPDIVQAFEHSYAVGVTGPIAADALHLILARDYGRAVYTKDEIVAALDLLCTPLVGALRRVTESAYALQMPMISIGRRFQAQASQLLEAVESQVMAAPASLGRTQRP